VTIPPTVSRRELHFVAVLLPKTVPGRRKRARDMTQANFAFSCLSSKLETAPCQLRSANDLLLHSPEPGLECAPWHVPWPFVFAARRWISFTSSP
jgi:hypothetical protein